MTEVFSRSLQIVAFFFVLLFTVAPIGMGAYALLFSRQFSLAMYRYRKQDVASRLHRT